MPSPVTPNEIKDTLPNVDSSLCDKLKKVIIDFPRKVYAWMSYMYNDDGTFSEDFKQEMCSINCDDINKGPNRPDVDNGGGGGTPQVKIKGAIATPATRYEGGIMLIWPKMDNAAFYTILRTPTITIDHDTPGSTYAASVTAVKVEGLQEALPSGKKVTFDNGTVLTTTGNAAIGTTAIACTLTGVLPDGEPGHLSATDAKIITKDKDLWTNPNWRQIDPGQIGLRRNSFCFIDARGMEIWDGTGYETHDVNGNLANDLKDGHRYNYFICYKSASGKYSAYSDPVVGFSKYVRGFSTETGTEGLAYSGGDDAYYEYDVKSDLTYPNSGKSYMRVVLRGGGGGGGAGGDYAEPTGVSYYVKAIAYDGQLSDEFTFTLGGSPNIEHFREGQRIKLKDNGNTKFNAHTFIIKSVSSPQFVCYKIDGTENLAGESSQSNGGTIPGTSDASHGQVYRELDKQKVKIAGGGGGAGGLLICVFEITNAITAFRVLTKDSSSTPKVVNYSDQGTAPLKQILIELDSEVDADHTIPFNVGGVGRVSPTVHPTAGEPSTNPGAHTTVAQAGDPTFYFATVDKTGYLAPYFTTLQVKTGGNWVEVARVADGQGGGYRNGFTDLESLGGKGGSTYTTTNITGCAIRTTALSKLAGAKDGKFFKKGTNGTNGVTSSHYGPEGGAFVGSGGYVWDGFKPIGPNTVLAAGMGGDTAGMAGTSFYLDAPGGGGSASSGSSVQTDTSNCFGGHAMAGCAWVTFSDNAYDLY